jgi:hypothetical protein
VPLLTSFPCGWLACVFPVPDVVRETGATATCFPTATHIKRHNLVPNVGQQKHVARRQPTKCNASAVSRTHQIASTAQHISSFFFICASYGLWRKCTHVVAAALQGVKAHRNKNSLGSYGQPGRPDCRTRQPGGPRLLHLAAGHRLLAGSCSAKQLSDPPLMMC